MRCLFNTCLSSRCRTVFFCRLGTTKCCMELSVTNLTYEVVLDSFHCLCIKLVGRDSAVGIATRYWLDGPGIESRWGRKFPYPSRPAMESTQPPIQWYRAFSGGKSAGAWRCPPTPHLAPRLKEE